MAGCGAAVGFGAVAPVGALLHPLHHQVQQGRHRLVYISTRRCARLKVGDAEEKGEETTRRAGCGENIN